MSEPDWQPVRRYVSAGDPARAACVLGALGLLGCLVGLRWYGVVAPSRGLEPSRGAMAVGGWESLTATRWVLVALCAGGLAVGLGRRSGAGRAVLEALGATATLLLGWRILIHPPQPARIVDVKLGGYLALLCSVTVLLGAAAIRAGTGSQPPPGTVG